MKKLLMRAMAALLVAAPLWASDSPSTGMFTAAKRSQALRRHFPDVRLVTHRGQARHFYRDLIKGKVVLINFMYTRCAGSCPRVTPNLAKAQAELAKRTKREVSMLSISVDPKNDTPQALKEYARQFRVGPRWHFLTGKKAEIDAIRRRLGVYDPDDQKSEHMNVLIIGNEATGSWVALPALSLPTDIADTTVRLLRLRGTP